jgi:hypothetical protein
MKQQQIKVRKGQVWRKRDSGRLGLITALSKNETCKIKLLGGPRNKTHETRIRDVRMFWDFVSGNKK